MKYYIIIPLLLLSFLGNSQADKALLKADKAATGLVYEANELIGKDDFVTAEMNYRRALSEAPNKAAGAYNLAHSYYKKGNYGEALFRAEAAAKNAKTKDEKHRAFHNIGNILMQDKRCKDASEAFKNALRNNPSDEETRYNYALAKECAEQQDQDGGGEDDKKDKDKDNQEDKNKDDQQKKEDENKDQKDNKDKGDKDKKEGEDEENKDDKPKDDKKNKDQGNKEKDKKNQKPKPGQMSPQQIKNILEAMQNQEQKVQQKINAKKQKGAKIKTEKDW